MKALVWAAVLVALAYFAWRGVLRGISQSGDLAVGYSAGHAWLIGHNPYDAQELHRILQAAGGGDLASGSLLDRLQDVYFPTTLPIFAPLALLSWPEARLVAIVANVAATAFIAVGLLRLIGWRLTSMKALLFIAALLALSPVHTTIALGQTGLLATAAIVAAMLAERAGRPYLAGILYGLATVFKVQIGLPFLVYLLWRRRWAMPSVAALVVVGATAISAIRMQAAAVPWLAGWLDNLASLSRPGGINDPSVLNPDRFSLINLQYPLRSIIDNGAVVDVATILVVGAAALAFAWLRRSRDAHPDLLSLSMVAVLGLLVAYHRYYDAVLLALPIAWACSVLPTPRRGLGVVVLLACADFVLPLQTTLHEFQQDGLLPAWLIDGGLWTVVIVAQHAWALVIVALVLLVAAMRDREAPVADTGLATT